MFADAISGILVNFAFEKINTQILNKIPYALLLSGFIAILPPTNDIIFNHKFDQIMIFGTIMVFMIGFFYFSSKYNKYLNDNICSEFFESGDFRNFLQKINKIFENKDSAVQDVFDASKEKFFIYGGISGILLTVVLIIAILDLFQLFDIQTPITIILLIFSALFIYLDSNGGNNESSNKNEKSNNMSKGIINQYFIQNSLDSMKIHDDEIPYIHIFSRLLWPITNIQLPKLTYEESLLYRTEKLEEKIRSFTKENAPIQFVYQEGIELDAFLALKNGHQFYEILHKSPMESFPNLLDPEFDANNHESTIYYILFRVLTVGISTKNVGYIVIHQFAGLKPEFQRRPHTRRTIGRKDLQPIYYILYMGDEEILSYVKFEFEKLAPKFHL